MSDPIQEQFANLRKTTEPRYLGRVKFGCLGVTLVTVAGFLTAGQLLNERGFFLAALMLGAIGLGTLREFIKQKAPHLARARQALDGCDSVPGTVRVVVEEDDDSKICRAAVQDRSGNDWTFLFSPEGWSPKTGDFPAELRYVEGVAWPALAITAAGILHPQFDPKQKRLALPEEEAAGSSAPKGQILFGVILIVVAIGWSSVIWHVYRLDARIIESGVAVEAEVVRVGHLRAKRDESHGLVYRFSLPDGRQFERTWSEEEGRWKAYRVGDRILIRYHPDDPERQLIENRAGTSLSTALLFIAISGLPFFGFGVAMVVSGIRKRRGDELS